MTRVLVVDAFSGAAGDMLLAALLDAGASMDVLRERVLSMPALAKVRAEVETVRRGAFAAKQLVVILPHEHAHRGLSDIRRILEEAPHLGDVARAHAIEAFTRLAMAEAKVHGTTVEKVHFHEVGALDAILDIAGFFACAESLGIDAFHYTNLVLGGGGVIRGAHGEMPAPAPATLELLAGQRVTYSERREELLTPTAAAIIAAVFTPLAADARVEQGRVGYGAGTRDSGDGMPNVVRVWTGDMATGVAREVAILRCTIDDMPAESYGHLMTRALAAGAREIYYTPVQMKKNRPGVEITLIAEERDVDAMSALLFAETTTLGLRVAREGRVELPRESATVQTPLGPVQVKIATLPDGSRRMSPEYEACRVIAEKTGRSLIDVYDVVRRAWSAS